MARRVNGTTDGLLVNATGLLASAGKSSMFVRFGIRSAATPQTIFRLGESGSSPFVGMGISGVSGKINGYHSTSGSLNTMVGASSHPTDGTYWTAAMVNDVAGSHVLYVNGISEATGSQSGGTQVNRTSNTDLMAGASKNFGERASADIAEIALWSDTLTADEVAALNAGFPPYLIRPSALVYYAPLYGNASPEQDLIGRKELVLTGTTKSDHPRVLKPDGRHWYPLKTAGGGGAPVNVNAQFASTGQGVTTSTSRKGVERASSSTATTATPFVPSKGVARALATSCTSATSSTRVRGVSRSFGSPAPSSTPFAHVFGARRSSVTTGVGLTPFVVAGIIRNTNRQMVVDSQGLVQYVHRKGVSRSTTAVASTATGFGRIKGVLASFTVSAQPTYTSQHLFGVLKSFQSSPTGTISMLHRMGVTRGLSVEATGLTNFNGTLPHAATVYEGAPLGGYLDQPAAGAVDAPRGGWVE